MSHQFSMFKWSLLLIFTLFFLHIPSFSHLGLRMKFNNQTCRKKVVDTNPGPQANKVTGAVTDSSPKKKIKKCHTKRNRTGYGNLSQLNKAN